MLKIDRKRYIVTINGGTEILCGTAKDLKFKSPDEIGSTAVKTYSSRLRAEQAIQTLKLDEKYDDIEIVPVSENIESYKQKG